MNWEKFKFKMPEGEDFCVVCRKSLGNDKYFLAFFEEECPTNGNINYWRGKSDSYSVEGSDEWILISREGK